MKPVVQLFSANGDGTGNTDMAVDGSSTPVLFTVDGPSSGDLTIARIMIKIEDSGSVTPATFGALTALTNGVDLELADSGGTLIADLWPVSVQTNADLALYAFDAGIEKLGTGLVTCRFSFDKFTPEGISLSASKQLQIRVNDNLTALTSMYVVAEGYEH